MKKIKQEQRGGWGWPAGARVQGGLLGGGAGEGQVKEESARKMGMLVITHSCQILYFLYRRILN